MEFHRILVATDLTKASEPAVNRAIGLARSSDAELLITHAYQPPSVVQADSFASGIYAEWDRTMRSNAEEQLRPIVEDAKRQGVKAIAIVVSGVPYDAISETAREKGADLVVMGTHGRTGVSRFFLGSVASRVISTAPCPVLTVRAV
jgi:nucleotide-binding universal stress UspA family protein